MAHQESKTDETPTAQRYQEHGRNRDDEPAPGGHAQCRKEEQNRRQKRERNGNRWRIQSAHECATCGKQ
jgi:hypothetical protein